MSTTAMTRIGSVSASQVIATFRHDFAVRTVCERNKCEWPAMSPDPAAMFALPTQRLQLLASARGPWALYFILECAWIAYDCPSSALLEMRAYHPQEPGRWTVGDFCDAYRRDPTVIGGEDAIKRVAALRVSIRSGDFDEGTFLAITSEAGRLIYPGAPVDTLCLVDGHHRFLALSEEGRMPALVKLFVGGVPEIHLGLTTINGKRKEGRK